MKLPWNKESDATADSADPDTTETAETSVDTDDDTDSTPVRGSSTTPGKGRPTPKRREAENRRRGPVAPPPTNRTEARARKKEIKKATPKADRKARSAELKAQRLEQRERMMAGEERYLMPRDKGEVRRYARDIVDSRRNFVGLFMPFAIVLIVVMFLPNLAYFSTPLLLVFVIFAAIDGYILGRIVNRRVRERFPDTTDGGFRLGWYAFTRAMQVRKMRAPAPQVSAGDEV
ncbi:DUF3043 domain-containing protein [Gordonia sp. ABSL1-1]|uniref:DUF3043 domain-containing protein n=1 Tax=Gordonia sp. ABSL1-1 TaxID=3053923 RepID=UPI00257427E2|nr:DUF3043 domain-containing protein [Gordonia sp. ABSL1-1]MDL9937355.1 DUF3043 domain-containing protein [Gordonia sp. ABSL1-1]